MKISIHKQKIIQQLKKQAFALHKQGLSNRQVAAVFEKKGTTRSHEWVRNAINELSKPRARGTKKSRKAVK